MKRIFCRFVLVLFLGVFNQMCTIQTPQEIQQSEITEIAKTIDACIGWAKTKDIDLLKSVIAHDTNYVSVTPRERIVHGYEQFKEAIPFWMDPNFQYGHHDISNLKITMSQSGDVAWFFCRLNDINTWKGQPASWENTRWTGVLEKRDGKWIIVQQHFSFAQ